ncbi:hypothetical protein Lgra_0218 [Legionella gratiana]|uniref:Uncharacterized protein n=2 Tax=Legionella gratiana TaxID=45066 RepID=A0A378JK74_9GAMM|nr:hypothetical protein Lgra_0218 [Legionella gratiana]STX45100.1 Uncharacterised protein [Legionella gratiana]
MVHKKIQHEESAYFVFTMQSAKGMEELHKNFAHKLSREDKNVGLSLTVAWSGESINVPVRPYQKNNIGFICDPRGIKVPQADLIAKESLGMLQREEYRQEKLKDNVPTKKTQFKHPTQQLTTDLTRHHYSEDETLIKTPKGSVTSWANNILDKYFKHKDNANSKKDYFLVQNPKTMRLNEGITFQKENKEGFKPISAPMIYKNATGKEANELLNFINNHPDYNYLFLYDEEAEKNILRYVSIEEAKKMLGNMTNKTAKEDLKNEFFTVFNNAAPYKRNFFELDKFDENEIKSNKDAEVEMHAREDLKNLQQEIKQTKWEVSLFGGVRVKFITDGKIDKTQKVPEGVNKILHLIQEATDNQEKNPYAWRNAQKEIAKLMAMSEMNNHFLRYQSTQKKYTEWKAKYNEILKNKTVEADIDEKISLK